ncbi:hypothetical protein [Agrobacterium tumefaciens]|uniref:hypothetical protein n=1 Tax=Agrobacterium tumefaciens TaxID=358 RepID=UPI001574A8F0|nr:hypothetical protein [Agrobacterium tumefaciens]NSX94504.1 hypothetical protein [Agrobacterium tumefaciens]
MNQPKLTAARLDAILSSNVRESRSALATESLWGAKAIGRFMGLSEDTVLRLEKRDPSFPVRRRGGRIFTTRTEIVLWLQPSVKDQRVTS